MFSGSLRPNAYARISFSKQKVAAVPGVSFAADANEISPSFRVNFSLPTDEQIDKGMQILGRTAEEYLAELMKAGK